MGSPADDELASLYIKHAARVRRFLARRGVRSADLDDVLQDTFVTIQRRLPEFEGRSSVETWLKAVGWRVVASYHRRRRARSEVGTLLEGRLASAPPAGGEMPASLRATDAEQRDLLALHEIGGLSISMLSELTGMARATIRQRIERGYGARRPAAQPAEQPAASSGHDAFVARSAGAERAELGPQAHVTSCGQVCITMLDDIVMTLWRGHCSIEGLHAVRAAFAAGVIAYPAGIRYFSIVEPTSSPPSFEGRQLHSELARTFGPKIRAAASTTESSALMALNVAVLNAYFAIARTPVNNRFFSDVASAVRWLARYGSTEPARITARVAAMRRRLDAEAIARALSPRPSPRRRG